MSRMMVLFGALALFSCGRSVLPEDGSGKLSATGPELGHLANALHGKLPDPTTELYMFTDDSGVSFPILVSNHRAYRLKCTGADGSTDSYGVDDLIRGAGFDPSDSGSFQQATFDSPALKGVLGIKGRDIVRSDFGLLPCHFGPSNGALLSIDVDNVREFFLDMNELDEANHNILRTVSCGELLAAMGLDLRNAPAVDLRAAQLHGTLDDKYNINCRSGTPPGQFLPTLVAVGGGLDQRIDRGSSISPLHFRVDHLGPNEVVKSLETTTNECFDQDSLAIQGLDVTGRISRRAPNSTCRTSFVARVGTGKDSSGNEVFFTTASLTLTVNLGCEINSLAHCGGCGAACVAGGNQAVSCVERTPGGSDYVCQATCYDGWGDCDGTAGNGCEARLDSLANCGQCGKACIAPNNTDATCGGRVCNVTCKADFADCDGVLANGCEANLWFPGTCDHCGNVCSANGECTHTSAGRECRCLPGYQGNGNICIDINECQTNNGGCAPANVAQCTNNPGGRSCACRPGFAGDGFFCVDVDECQANNGGCAPADVGKCTNTPGSRSCACKPGFSGDGFTCTDINECLANNGGCSPNAACTNTVGSRLCQCKYLYRGDGIVCTKDPLWVDGPYNWQQGTDWVDLGDAQNRICWLSRVAGRFMGGGEWVDVRYQRNTILSLGASAASYIPEVSWTLRGGSKQAGVAASALCTTSRAPFWGVYSWKQGQPPTRLGDADRIFCFLSSVTGRFEGWGEYVHAYVSNGSWYLGGDSQQVDVAATATCYMHLEYSYEYVWKQGQDSVPMVGTGKACALTYIGGKFKGAGEEVGITRYYGNLYLGGASQQSDVQARARCFW